MLKKLKDQYIGVEVQKKIFLKKMKLFGTLNSLNNIKNKGDKIEREKRRYNQ